ncbi:hypothetical protein [Fervidobacterium sp. 2310opik-2]|uniref:hypothetical protein n=1 Tax=Fervidobacterium sp. 2310opik-2 TaxID=1755815 RepID=UPI0013E0BE36|nr:hypothetical protein [Fervidobacterium sp. 2310opik-2]KAF2960925.1 hypothetical protein AS161_03640 [Fervidobacterium sp. 2310opik-2]
MNLKSNINSYVSLYETRLFVQYQSKKYLILILKTLIVCIVLLLLLYDYNKITNNLAAITLVFISFLWVLETLNNLPMFLMASFIMYINYSISIGEFLTTVPTSCPLNEVENLVNYGIAIRVILVFITIVFIFYKPRPYLTFNRPFEIENDFVFLSMIFISIYIFFQTRDIDRTVYNVAITPAFEYSKIFFLSSSFMVGKKKWRKVLIIILSLLYILKDFYYGGRVTSLQIIFVLILTLFIEHLDYSKLLLLGFFGLILLSFIGAYRASYTFNISLFDVLKILFSSLFVFDTATYSFYASATHIAASQIANLDLKFESFFQFLGAVFTSSSFFSKSDVTTLSAQFYLNVGGGILPTHFYFWGSWSMVILFGLLFVFFLNRLRYNSSLLARLTFLTIVISSPRWYVYGPLNLLRGAIFLPVIVYIFILILNSLSRHK